MFRLCTTHSIEFPFNQVGEVQWLLLVFCKRTSSTSHPFHFNENINRPLYWHYLPAPVGCWSLVSRTACSGVCSGYNPPLCYPVSTLHLSPLPDRKSDITVLYCTSMTTITFRRDGSTGTVLGIFKCNNHSFNTKSLALWALTLIRYRRSTLPCRRGGSGCWI